MRRAIRAWTAALLAAGLTLTGIGAAAAADPAASYVGACREGAFSTIQAAVNVAGAGTTIYVCPGTYNEQVTVVDKVGLTIRNLPVKGRSAPLVDLGASGTAFIVVGSSDVQLRGLRVTAGFGVAAISSPGTVVRGMSISRSGVGIQVIGSPDAVIDGNVLVAQGGDTSPGDGLQIISSDDVTATGNEVSGGPDGVLVVSSDRVVAVSNSVVRADNGYIVVDAEGSRLTLNRSKFNTIGILLAGSSGNRLNRNTARANVVGLEVDGSGNVLRRNRLLGNSEADATDSGTGNTWVDNRCDSSTPADLCGTAATSRLPEPTLPDVDRLLREVEERTGVTIRR